MHLTSKDTLLVLLFCFSSINIYSASNVLYVSNENHNMAHEHLAALLNLNNQIHLSTRFTYYRKGANKVVENVDVAISSNMTVGGAIDEEVKI